MENSLSKESDLKFTKQDFRELSAPDNILNVWYITILISINHASYVTLILNTVKKY